MKEKQLIRQEIWEKLAALGLSHSFNSIPPFKGQEQAAERLRELEVYIQARKVFVPPDMAQFEVRWNVLRDSKVLVMATPRLRDGFYEVNQSISRHLWTQAIRSSGIRKLGKRLITSKDDIGEIDLLVTGAVAVSLSGERLGKGTGYFDLEYAILREIDSTKAGTPIIVVVHDLQVYDELPWDEKDISVDFIVTPTQTIRIESPRPRPMGIAWHRLDKHVLAAMRPLKELSGFE